MAEYPKLVIVVDPNGVETTRIVANSIEQHIRGETLLNRILIALTLINGICASGTERANDDKIPKQNEKIKKIRKANPHELDLRGGYSRD